MSKLRTILVVIVVALLAAFVADQIGLINLRQEDTNLRSAAVSVTWLATSSIDRSGSQAPSETIVGNVIEYIMIDAQSDGLGDFDGDLQVCSLSTDPNERLVDMKLSFVGFTVAAGQQQDIINRTDALTRYDVSWSLTDVGSPTLNQVGDAASSGDWTNGKSDQLNFDVNILPDAMDDLAAPGQVDIRFTVNSVEMTVRFSEAR